MSQELPTWYVSQWRQTTIHKYQRQGFRLRNTIMPPHEVRGEKLIFRLMDVMQAERDVGRGEVVKENSPALTKVELETKKTRLAFFVDEDDLDLTDLGPGVISSHGQAGANEMGRVHDDIIFAEMDAGAVNEVGAYTSPITPATLMQAKQSLHAAEVETQDGQVFCALDSVSWNVCMDYKAFANADWAGPNMPFVDGGMAKTWNGIHLFVPSDKLFPIGADATEVKCFMWHKSAFGFGSLYNPPMRASGAWQENRSGWLHTLRHRYGAKTLQGTGIIRLKTDYDASLIVATK